MKKGNLIFLLFLICCKSQTKDYKVVYTSNSKIEATFYFHFNNMEFARTLGNSSKSDSLIFTKKKNDLIVRVFKFNENQKKKFWI